jgi:hypothetical protein
MPATVAPGKDVEFFMTPSSIHHVQVGDFTLFTVPDAHAADKIARHLNAARQSSYYNAMNILTDKLFLGEDMAKQIYHMLFEAEQQIGVQSAKPN